MCNKKLGSFGFSNFNAQSILRSFHLFPHKMVAFYISLVYSSSRNKSVEGQPCSLNASPSSC